MSRHSHIRGSRSPVLPALLAVPPQQTIISVFGQVRGSNGGGNRPELAQADSSNEMTVAADILSNRVGLNGISLLSVQKRHLASYFRDCKNPVSGGAQALDGIGRFIEANSRKPVMKLDQQLGWFDRRCN